MKYFASAVRSILFGVVLAGSLAMTEAAGFSGKVTETMNAGTYTYVLVDTGTNKVWAAATQFPVKVGDSVSVPAGVPMEKFHSKSLNRDFEVIYFTETIRVNGSNPETAKLPPGHPGSGGVADGSLPAGHPALPGKGAPPKVDFTDLKPAKDGKTIAQIYAASVKLAGKSVKCRGKVVKYNASIMGRNWLHIQDGTGAAGSNDILITSENPAKLGDTVLIEGKVALKKDFGAGYKYDVLIEDAKVTVE